MYALSLSFFMNVCLLLVIQTCPGFGSLEQKQSAAPHFQIARREAGSGSAPAALFKTDSHKNRESSRAASSSKDDLATIAARRRQAHEEYKQKRIEGLATGDPAVVQVIEKKNERARDARRQEAAAQGKTVFDNIKKRSKPGEIARRKQERREFRRQQDALILERKRQWATPTSAAGDVQEKSPVIEQQFINQKWPGGALPTARNALNQGAAPKGDPFSDYSFRKATEAVQENPTEISSPQNRGRQSERVILRSPPRDRPSNLMPTTSQSYQNFHNHDIWQHTAPGTENQSSSKTSSPPLSTAPAVDPANMVQVFKDIRNGVL